MFLSVLESLGDNAAMPITLRQCTILIVVNTDMYIGPHKCIEFYLEIPSQY